MFKLRSLWVTTFKGVLGISLLAIVLGRGWLDFGKLGDFLWRPWNLFVGASVMLLTSLIFVAKWWWVNRAFGYEISYRRSFQIVMLSSFLGTLIPGALGGDALRGLYLWGEGKGTGGQAAASVLFDRISAAFWLILISFLALFHPMLNNRLPWVGELKFLLLAILVASSLVYFFLWKASPWLYHLASVPRWLKLPLQMFSQTENQIRLIGAALMGGMMVLANCMGYFVLGELLGVEAPLSLYFFVIPLGVLAMVLPILPLGIGVGQFVFYYLFRLAGVEDAQSGVTLVTVWQAYALAFNLVVGFWCYLRFKRVISAVPVNEPKEFPSHSQSSLRGS